MGSTKQSQLDKQDNRRGATGKGKKGGIAFGDYQFVRIELTAEEKDMFAEWVEDAPMPMPMLADVAQWGYKLSVSYADEGRTCLTTLTCIDPSLPDAGGVLTARGKNLTVSIAVLYYKLTVIIGDRLWREAESERGGGYSDIG